MDDKELLIKIKVAADLAAANAAKQALEGIGKAAAKGGKETASGAQSATQQLGELKKSGKEATEVFRGLSEASEGGVRGVLGSLNAAKGVVGLFKSIGSVLAGPVGVALGAAAAGISYLGRIAEKNKKQIEEIFSGAAEESKKMKEAYVAIDEAAKKSLESQLEKVREVTKGYDELIAAMDKAEARNKKMREAGASITSAKLDRDEQAALAKATTPEERDAITERFKMKRENQALLEKQGEINYTESTALKRKMNAEQALADISGQRSAAASDADQKRVAANDAIGAAQAAFRANGETSSTRELRRKAQDAQRVALDAEQGVKKVNADTAEAYAKAVAEIEQAKLLAQLVPLQREALKVQQETLVLARRNAADPKLKEFTAAAQSALEKGDANAVGRAQAEIEKINSNLKQATPKLMEAAKEAKDSQTRYHEAVIVAVKSGAATAEKATRQITNGREVGP